MGSGTAVATGDAITAAKMNLKLETIVDADITHDSGDWTVGVDGAGQDIIYYTNTAGRVMTWDPSDSALELDDNVILAFGSADDVEVYWDAAKLLWLPLTDDTGIFQIGNGTKGIDFLWFGGTTSNYVRFDLGSDKVTLEGVDLYIGDTDYLIFGDGADIVIDWTGALLLLVPATNDTGAINIGDGTTDIDVKIFLGAAGVYAEFNVGDAKLTLVGVASTILTITSTLTGATADDATEITVTNSQTCSSGYAHALHINLTKSGTTSGGCSVTQFNGIGIDYTISGGGSSGYYGLYAYIAKSGSPDLSAAAVFGAVLDVTEVGAVDYIGGLWLNKYNTTKGSLDAFILMANQGSGVTKTGFYFQGTNLPDYLITLASANANDMLVDGTPTGSTKKYLKVSLGGTDYGIEVNSVA